MKICEIKLKLERKGRDKEFWEQDSTPIDPSKKKSQEICLKYFCIKCNTLRQKCSFETFYKTKSMMRI